jgi:hypothetical protein
MRFDHGYFLSASIFGLGLGLVGVACASQQQGSQGVAGASQARLVVENEGSADGSFHVTVKNQATNEIALDQTLQVKAKGATVFTSSLPPATYTFSAELAGEGAAAASTGIATANLKSGEATEIEILAPPTANGSLAIGIGGVPQIFGVDAQLAGSPQAGTVDVNVSATSPTGGALTFFWSGAGLSGTAQSSKASLSLPAASITAAAPKGSATLHVVAQDAAGVATSADISLAVSGAGAEAALVGGSIDSTTTACLAAQASCTTACTASLQAGGLTISGNPSCLASCGTSLASCPAQ